MDDCYKLSWQVATNTAEKSKAQASHEMENQQLKRIIDFFFGGSTKGY